MELNHTYRATAGGIALPVTAPDSLAAAIRVADALDILFGRDDATVRTIEIQGVAAYELRWRDGGWVVTSESPPRA